MKYLSVLLFLIFGQVLLAAPVDLGPLFPTLVTSTGTSTAPNSCSVGDSPTAKVGIMAFGFRDSSGNYVLPQLNASSEILVKDTTTNTEIGIVTETAPATDTASSGLNGRLQRIAQRLTTLIAFYAADFGASSGAIRVAALPGNASGIADFNSGTSGAQTPRSAANIYGIVQTSAPTAGTNATVKQSSLDSLGKQFVAQSEAANTEWGQMFHVSTNTATLTGTTETAFFYFQNPNGSGKTAKIYRITFEPTTGNNYVTYRVYIDPTVSASGTGLSEFGNRQTGQNANVVNAFTVPTVSANGSLYKTVILSGLSGVGRDMIYNFSLWVEANHTLLITRQLSANTTIGGVSVEWAEQ